MISNWMICTPKCAGYWKRPSPTRLIRKNFPRASSSPAASKTATVPVALESSNRSRFQDARDGIVRNVKKSKKTPHTYVAGVHGPSIPCSLQASAGRGLPSAPPTRTEWGNTSPHSFAPSTGYPACLHACQLPGMLRTSEKPSCLSMLAAILARYPLPQ